MSFLRSGGGGGGPAPAPRHNYTDMRGQQQSRAAAPQQFRDFSRTAQVMGNPEEAAKYRMEDTPQSFLYSDGSQPSAGARPTNMMGAVQGMSGGRDPSTIASDSSRMAAGIGMGGQSRRVQGTTPAMSQLPPAEFMVQRQAGADAVGGGEPGVGEQGFGRRALMGAEGQLLDIMPPPGTPEQGTEVMAYANPDLLGDPNMPALGPNASVAPDVNYIVPTGNRDDQLAAFIANDPRAAAIARGPLSRNLVVARQTRGFGNSLMNI